MSCKRAVSAYINKFVVVPTPRGPDGVPVVIAGTIDWVYAQRGEPPDYDRAVTFAEFVDSIVKNSDADLDTHFKSQHSLETTALGAPVAATTSEV